MVLLLRVQRLERELGHVSANTITAPLLNAQSFRLTSVYRLQCVRGAVCKLTTLQTSFIDNASDVLCSYPTVVAVHHRVKPCQHLPVFHQKWIAADLTLGRALSAPPTRRNPDLPCPFFPSWRGNVSLSLCGVLVRDFELLVWLRLAGRIP